MKERIDKLEECVKQFGRKVLALHRSKIDEINVKMIGKRVGEKLHEELMTPDEILYAEDNGELFIIRNEINENHPIANKLKDLYKENKDELKNYTKILYNGARLIEGLAIDNPTEFNNLICDIISQ